MTEIESQYCREAKRKTPSLWKRRQDEDGRGEVEGWCYSKEVVAECVPETPRLRNSDLTYHPKPWVEQRLLA
jgi:hypothetical protein